MTRSITDPEPEAPPAEAGEGRSSWRGRTITDPWLLGAIGLIVFAAVYVGVDRNLGVVSLVTTMLMFVVLGQGWNILGGYAGYLNLGTGAFFGVGAYAAAILFENLQSSLLLSVPAGALAAAALAVIIGIPTLRLRGSYFTILTLVLGFLLQRAAFNFDWTRGAFGIYLDQPGSTPRATALIFLYSFAALAVLTTVIVFVTEHSKFGYALRTINEDEDAAQVLGVATTSVKMKALVLSSLIAGAAGALYAYNVAYIEPGGTFAITLSIDVVLVCVIGGLGSWQGALVGAPIVVMLADYLQVWFSRVSIFGASVPPEMSRLVLGLVLILVAIFAKRGLVGVVRAQRGRSLGV